MDILVIVNTYIIYLYDSRFFEKISEKVFVVVQYPIE